jgi:hypothetical protein
LDKFDRQTQKPDLADKKRALADRIAIDNSILLKFAGK